MWMSGPAPSSLSPILFTNCCPLGRRVEAASLLLLGNHTKKAVFLWIAVAVIKDVLKKEKEWEEGGGRRKRKRERRGKVGRSNIWE